MTEVYKPQKKTAAMLDRAWELVNEVPYQVSARWLFYRLLQENWYSKKKDYNNKFMKAISTARKTFYGDWRPSTLADETRVAVSRGNGERDVEHWVNSISEWGISCRLDKWYSQEHYLELWFEARAMTDQFRHYTNHITLRPMAGQPSIPFKWDAAKALERAEIRYGDSIIILYFGDLDSAGETISEVIERDVREWCAVDFEFIRCGLNSDQVQRYGVPENPEKPGEYQWEALPDMAAKEIISGHVDQYLRHDAFSELETEERNAESWLRGELAGLADRWEPHDAA